LEAIESSEGVRLASPRANVDRALMIELRFAYLGGIGADKFRFASGECQDWKREIEPGIFWATVKLRF
jgi:hypothetical protein